MSDQTFPCAGCGEPVTPDEPRIVRFPGVAASAKGDPPPAEPELVWHNLGCLDRWRNKTTPHPHP